MKVVLLNYPDIETFLKELTDFSYDYRNDFAAIPLHNLTEVLRFATNNYQVHFQEAEVMTRPKIFFKYGGDCDQAVSFILSFLFFRNYDLRNFRYVLSEAGDVLHLQLATYPKGGEVILDTLPEDIFANWVVEAKNFKYFEIV